MTKPIENRVAKSKLIVCAVEDFFPRSEDLLTLDIASGLEDQAFLRETSYRLWIKHYDFTPFRDKYVRLTCSAEAIVPAWAYILPTMYLRSAACLVVLGDHEALKRQAFLQILSNIDWKNVYTGAQVMLKGCNTDPLSAWAHVQITQHLLPYVASLMYGEPCSAVPIYKKKLLK